MSERKYVWEIPGNKSKPCIKLIEGTREIQICSNIVGLGVQFTLKACETSEQAERWFGRLVNLFEEKL